VAQFDQFISGFIDTSDTPGIQVESFDNLVVASPFPWWGGEKVQSATLFQFPVSFLQNFQTSPLGLRLKLSNPDLAF
jgi:hypothetical protein